MNIEQDQLKNHEYDGIQEYDNPLPNWWLVTFMGTVIFSFIYFIHYELGGGPNQAQEYELAIKTIEQNKKAAPVVMLTDAELEAKMQDPQALELGAQIFKSNCVACHGDQLQGLIGPNLADKYWLHGKATRADILALVKDGIPDKGMPAWGPVLKSDDVMAVSAYVFSKKNTNPANGKAPQGEAVE